MVADGTLAQQIIPLIHSIPQLDAIYVFCRNKNEHEKWSKEWIKIKGVYAEILPICESLQQAVKECNQNSIPMSFISIDEEICDKNLNQLEPSFMYTQIFKDVLLEMEHNQQSIKDFTTYCRTGNHGSPNNITKFENEYNAKLAIWWYTYPSFIYSLLNGALRMLEADTIIKIGFFIRDLHYQIQELHQKQVHSYQYKSFIVYRGQSLSTADFEKLQKKKGGLMSFNNFLSTSRAQDLALALATSALGNTDTVGILFQMTVDPSVSTAAFAEIHEVSYYEKEEEILFTMHTVFHINEIEQIDENNPLYRVNLKLTADDDKQLRTLTEFIINEAGSKRGWNRLSTILMQIGQYDKCEELCNTLLEQTSDESEKATYLDNLGCLRHKQGNYQKAISYLEQGLDIRQKTRPPNPSDLADSYNYIGLVYDTMGEYSKALSFHEKAIEIKQETLPPSHSSLATSYNNIGAAYYQIGEYSKALSFYERALEIRQKILPPNHPDLATSYNNIGVVYGTMGDYSKALSFYEKSLEIQQETLPPNHSSLATSYNNIGAAYYKLGEYSKTLSFNEKALEIQQKIFSPHHPDLATSYNNIGLAYDEMGKYSKALSFHEKVAEIHQKTLPPNYTLLATSYNNIGLASCKIGEYLKALSFFERAYEIYQKTLPLDHLLLATSHNNIGTAYEKMGEYAKARLSYEKALEIQQKTLPPNHPDLSISYINIGSVYCKMGAYWKTLSFNERALEILKKTLPPNHSFSAFSYTHIASAYYNMGEYWKALSFYERALKIFKNSLPENHPYIQSVQDSIEIVQMTLLRLMFDIFMKRNTFT
jgi:tetratricopeptide (TPR) repeat protein